MQELTSEVRSAENEVLEKYKADLDGYRKQRDKLIEFIINQAPTDSQRLKKITEADLTSHLKVMGVPADLVPHILGDSLSKIHAAANEVLEVNVL